jgi:hypothetical protein
VISFRSGFVRLPPGRTNQDVAVFRVKGKKEKNQLVFCIGIQLKNLRNSVFKTFDYWYASIYRRLSGPQARSISDIADDGFLLDGVNAPSFGAQASGGRRFGQPGIAGLGEKAN